MQTRKLSLIEAWTNMIIGFLLSWSVIALLLSLHPQATALFIVIAATFTSFLRQYTLRRAFNAYENRRT